MPAIAKNKIPKKSDMAPPAIKKKTPKSKLISSQPGVQPMKKPKSTKNFDPLKAQRGVVFIKHIPHGFYEQQLKAYFEQFGKITRIRVARSEKSGRSKGYAFLEFKVKEVAEIAASTMDNYLMFKHVLQTAYIPPEEQKFNYFRNTVHTVNDNGINTLVTPKTQRVAREMKRINAVPTQEQHEARVARALHKLKKIGEKYAAQNIDIDLDYVAPVPSKAVSSTPKSKALADKTNVSTKKTKASTSQSSQCQPSPIKSKKLKMSAKSELKSGKTDVSLATIVNNDVYDSDDDDDDYVPEEDVPSDLDISEASDTSNDSNVSDNELVELLPMPATPNAINRKRKIAPLTPYPQASMTAKYDTLKRFYNTTIDETNSSDDDYIPEAPITSIKGPEKQVQNTPGAFVLMKLDQSEKSINFSPDLRKKKKPIMMEMGGIKKKSNKKSNKPKKGGQLKFGAKELMSATQSLITKINPGDLKRIRKEKAKN